MERRDLLYYPQQGTTVSSSNGLVLLSLWSSTCPFLKIWIPYLAYVLDDSVTFLSGKSYSPDISLCKKAGLSDLRMCLCTTAHTRLRFWVITGLVTSPDNFIIQYLSSLSIVYFRFFQNFLLPPLPLAD